jgi:hypothetical protein
VPAEAGADGSDPTIGGPCIDDAQCDDKIDCTFDACDPTLKRCRNTPDDSRCDDGIYCNGRERCVPAHGCEPGPVVTCEDGDPCTIDRCVEATKSCTHTPRDLDEDGDPDDHCVPKHDCNDLDPGVSSTHPEVCANGKDDNCNGLIDETPCDTPANDTCSSALSVGSPGTYAMSTVGAHKDYSESCSVTNPTTARDVVAAITIPGTSPKDLEVWATVQSTEVSVAIFGACGQAGTELACGSASGATSIRSRARALAPGTYYAIITTQLDVSIELKVDFLDPTPKPANESCTAPAPIAAGTPFTVQIVDPSKDLVSACAAQTGELTYALTLTQAANVHVLASTQVGSGTPVVGLRAPHCTDPTDELFCRVGDTPPLVAHALQPGTYVLTVAGTTPIDASILVETSPPTHDPPDQLCSTAPSLGVNQTVSVDLTDHEDAIKDGCSSGSPNAAGAISLTEASDVMVIGRFPQNESGAVSLDAPACTASDVKRCGTGSTPVRIDIRNVPAGDYRVVVNDSYGEADSVTVLTRPTVAPTVVTGADNCGDIGTIPPSGGFFTGDTSLHHPDFSDGCDAPNQQTGGAPDQILQLDLAQPEHVVFNMDGSVYSTILDIRQGATCPGQELPGDCYVGFSGPRSFLDLELAAGTYFVVIDGYAGAAGAWDLDVRVLPP